MRVLRVICGLGAVAYLGGCAGVRQTSERPDVFPLPLSIEKVPLPSSTPYDREPALRSAYLDGYRLGYRYAAVGTGISNCGWSQTPAFRAGQRGVDDGQRAGFAVYKLAPQINMKLDPKLEEDLTGLQEVLTQELLPPQKNSDGEKNKTPNSEGRVTR